MRNISAWPPCFMKENKNIFLVFIIRGIFKVFRLSNSFWSITNLNRLHRQINLHLIMSMNDLYICKFSQNNIKKLKTVFLSCLKKITRAMSNTPFLTSLERHQITAYMINISQMFGAITNWAHMFIFVSFYTVSHLFNLPSCICNENWETRKNH